jgi:hypothetical protein
MKLLKNSNIPVRRMTEALNPSFTLTQMGRRVASNNIRSGLGWPPDRQTNNLHVF